MITDLIRELVIYGKNNGLICEADEVYATNRLLELFDVMEYEENPEITESRAVCEILEDMMTYAHENGIMKEDTITAKDLFDTKIMGCITPPPSVVRAEFAKRYAESPKEATNYYYQFSQATNYIRKDRIAKDEKWVTDTEYGPIDITINLSKPEKDPRDIAKAGQAKKSGYPACLLCKENEGYAGHFSHPARQNHRVIPIKLDGQNYYLQYSPYVYYNEHCIIFNEQHIPMKIDYAVFRKLLDFVRQYPHYMAGSNADLPIVGGSILSHDHFQGGGYVFAMAKADYERKFVIPGFESVTAGIVKWRSSVCRAMIWKRWRKQPIISLQAGGHTRMRMRLSSVRRTVSHTIRSRRLRGCMGISLNWILCSGTISQPKNVRGASIIHRQTCIISRRKISV